jgi:hypothetical protein
MYFFVDLYHHSLEHYVTTKVHFTEINKNEEWTLCPMVRVLVGMETLAN